MWLIRILVVLAAVYLLLLVALFFGQAQLIFPRGMVAEPSRPLPATAERLTLATADGETLAGLRIPPAESPQDAVALPLTVLGFSGNAWHADDLAMFLHDMFPAATIVAFHYRGYAPSTGTPGAKAILSDALAVYDHVSDLANGNDGGRIVLVGFSLGSAVATRVAAARSSAGLILVSPFDSMSALTRQHYPWVPAQWILRHRFPTVEWAGDVTAPVAILAAADDTLVPPERTDALRARFATLAYDRTIPGTGHVEIYRDPRFAPALREALAALSK